MTWCVLDLDDYYGSLASPHHHDTTAFTTAFTAACEMSKNMMDKVHVN